LEIMNETQGIVDTVEAPGIPHPLWTSC